MKIVRINEMYWGEWDGFACQDKSRGEVLANLFEYAQLIYGDSRYRTTKDKLLA